MVMIGFTVDNAIENIQSGVKRTTIRKYSPKRLEQIERIRKLQLYWKPRTKDCKHIADVKLEYIVRFKFPSSWEEANEDYDYWEYTAKKDGFKNYVGMIYWFEQEYGDELYDMDFMIIQWFAPTV